jgi:hypothetical protein
MGYLDKNGLRYFWTQIKTLLNSKAESSHTHNYAGSSSAGGSATSAVKLTTSAGTSAKPVFFQNGKPVACDYSIGDIDGGTP